MPIILRIFTTNGCWVILCAISGIHGNHSAQHLHLVSESLECRKPEASWLIAALRSELRIIVRKPDKNFANTFHADDNDKSVYQKVFALNRKRVEVGDVSLSTATCRAGLKWRRHKKRVVQHILLKHSVWF
ncbi:hypothetical protein CEXT_503781 [Caerostris extrusa]|uniref:Uncharacterized protein n=1 Tax=Caerostris extrusa TaxID=172846 RepID=A0AAV4PYV0_CAEEX|nr:hypothetical protein CEXT_503781 [Caerostris extrusa]